MAPKQHVFGQTSKILPANPDSMGAVGAAPDDGVDHHRSGRTKIGAYDSGGGECDDERQRRRGDGSSGGGNDNSGGGGGSADADLEDSFALHLREASKIWGWASVSTSTSTSDGEGGTGDDRNSGGDAVDNGSGGLVDDDGQAAGALKGSNDVGPRWPKQQQLDSAGGRGGFVGGGGGEFAGGSRSVSSEETPDQTVALRSNRLATGTTEQSTLAAAASAVGPAVPQEDKEVSEEVPGTPIRPTAFSSPHSNERKHMNSSGGFEGAGAADLSSLRGCGSGGGHHHLGGVVGVLSSPTGSVFTETGASVALGEDEDLSRISDRIRASRSRSVGDGGGGEGIGAPALSSYDLSSAPGSGTTSGFDGGEETTARTGSLLSRRAGRRLAFGSDDDGLMSSGTEGTGVENTTTAESTLLVASASSDSYRGVGNKLHSTAKSIHFRSDPSLLPNNFDDRHCPPDRARTSSASSIDASHSSSTNELNASGEDYFSQGSGVPHPMRYSITPATASGYHHPRPEAPPRQRSVSAPSSSLPLSDDLAAAAGGPRVRITPIDRIPYVHGGYAPSAPLMLQDGRWMEILRRLMPEAYAGAAALLRHAAEQSASSLKGSNGQTPADQLALDQARVMKWAENNPVVAAYGMLNSKGGDGGTKEEGSDVGSGGGGSSEAETNHTSASAVSAAEVPPPPPPMDGTYSSQRRMRRRRQHRVGSFSSSASMGFDPSPHPPSSFAYHDSPPARRKKSFAHGDSHAFTPKPALEWDVFLDPILVRHVDKAIRVAEELNIDARRRPTEVSYDQQIAADVEVDRQIARLMDRMILAHGSTTQLVAEAVGMAPRYNFSRVVEQGESKRRSESRRRNRRRKSATSGGSIIQKIIKKKSPPNEAPKGAPNDGGGGAGAGGGGGGGGVSGSNHAGRSMQARIPSITSITSVTTTQQVVATAEAEGVRGSKYAPSSGIFVDRWLSLFAKALRMGREWSSNGGGGGGGGGRFERTLSYRSYSTPHFVRSHKSNVSVLSDMDCADSVASVNTNNADNTGEVDGPILAAPPLCGIFLCFGMDDPNSIKADHGRSSMADSARTIADLLGSPLRVVMDLKSRRVPPRVWARLVDNLRSRGLGVDGLGSFNIDELRNIGSFCSTPVTQCIFFHSAGDMQRACHAREVTHGDTVYFNAGSLLWKRPTFYEASGMGCCAADPTTINMSACGFNKTNDITCEEENDGLRFNGYVFQPYAYPREKIKDSDGLLPDCKATLQDYKKHLDLKIGLYVQEFSIGHPELDALVKLVNQYPEIFNLGLAWGGINGSTVRGVEGDGFWNQRYIGRNWDFEAEPAEHMKLLNPEDHHMFQKAIHAGDWAQLATINQIAIDPEEQEGPLVQAHLCKPH
eukprot:CAMPEP_0197465510 /NCGR_PEP_ID=MMETSP1175-20131217/64577_1 /TAXON_ID=1003142 /ORGANISM="Triceratium dubium, Strain CCMP147" /LENGTH=1372 /DNA_ID=CAMNT_0043001527 /DNA_START=615 /DNA_END=4733 /DNA_ORIENTATION=+